MRKALGERLGLLKTGSLSLSLSLSPLYHFHPSISFTSLSLSPLSYLSVPLYISPSTFLSIFSLSFSFAYLMDVFALVLMNDTLYICRHILLEIKVIEGHVRLKLICFKISFLVKSLDISKFYMNANKLKGKIFRK